MSADTVPSHLLESAWAYPKLVSMTATPAALRMPSISCCSANRSCGSGAAGPSSTRRRGRTPTTGGTDAGFREPTVEADLVVFVHQRVSHRSQESSEEILGRQGLAYGCAQERGAPAHRPSDGRPPGGMRRARNARRVAARRPTRRASIQARPRARSPTSAECRWSGRGKSRNGSSLRPVLRSRP